MLLFRGCVLNRFRRRSRRSCFLLLRRRFCRRFRLARDAPLDLRDHLIFERAGMRFLLGDPELGQQIEDHVGLDFKLTSQLIDADFTHKEACPAETSGRTGLSLLSLFYSLIRRRVLTVYRNRL